MGKRLSKIYTRTGDTGETGLGDGSRVPKEHARVQAMGSVDELNSHVGLLIEELALETAKTADALAPTADFLRTCQHRIFDLGGEISIPGFEIIKPHHTTNIEQALDEMNKDLPPLENFILPGGNRLIATFHLARSVCRRAERDLIALSRDEVVNPEGIRFLNRLSDYLFVGARFTASTLGVQEVLWQKDQETNP